MMATELTTNMKKCLANVFVFYTQAHNYHLNVVGPFFHSYHDFFQKLYDELWLAIDATAEQIRALDSFILFTCEAFGKDSEIKLENKIPVPMKMVKNLIESNDIVIKCLRECRDLAEQEKNQGLVNFLEERLDIHAKHMWMLKALDYPLSQK